MNFSQTLTPSAIKQTVVVVLSPAKSLVIETACLTNLPLMFSNEFGRFVLTKQSLFTPCYIPKLVLLFFSELIIFLWSSICWLHHSGTKELHVSNFDNLGFWPVLCWIGLKESNTRALIFHPTTDTYFHFKKI